MSSEMGDGDLADPAVQGIDADELVVPSDHGGVTDSAATDDVPERASEIDDITESTPRPDLDLTEVDVQAVMLERDEYREIAQRVQAEFENYRRQAINRARTDADLATGRLAEALLPVLDAAEAAFVNHPDEIGPLLNTMLTELKKHGLETLDLDGQPFDPEVADAVAHEPGGGGETVVADVLRSGYRWKGRTLRPAMVRTRD